MSDENQERESADESLLELEQLCDAAADGRLTERQRDRIEELVLADAALRRFYVERMHLNATLAWADDRSDLAADAPTLAVAGRARARVARLLRDRNALAWTSLCALLVLFAGWWIVSARNGASHGFATLAETDRCVWQSCSTSTEPGSRLRDDDLNLAAGLAHVKFDNDVDLYLEGPCHVRITSPDSCFLYGGQVVAKVGPKGVGFTIDTPGAEVEDFGTEFGVTVHDDLSSDVEVFQGRVDVKGKVDAEVTSMTAGLRARFDASGRVDPRPDAATSSFDVPATALADRIVRLSTALGRGKTTFVQPEVTVHVTREIAHDSDVYMLIKNSAHQDGQWNRKAYFAIDLQGVRKEDLRDHLNDARLMLSFGPTGVGFMSRSPEVSWFSVHGLTDQSLDDWSESGLTWDNAPANLDGGAAVDSTRTVLLGRFAIPRSESGGMRVIEGAALREFLLDDTNGLATFIVVRDTPETEGEALAHGIADNRHPVLPPPTLRLSLDR